jgi:hypothetical protein
MLAIAVHNYHDSMGRLPQPAIYDKSGKPLLSWRVALLPYIEEAALYNEFKLDEPWDSAHNKKLLAKMPKVYAPARGKTKEPYTTYLQVFSGPGAVFEPDPKVDVRITSIPDGISNTLLMVEAGEAVPWTKPDDIPFDPKKPLPKLGGVFEDGFHASFVDGHVTFFKKTIPADILKAMITRAGGEVIPDFSKFEESRPGGRRPGTGFKEPTPPAADPPPKPAAKP